MINITRDNFYVRFVSAFFLITLDSARNKEYIDFTTISTTLFLIAVGQATLLLEIMVRSTAEVVFGRNKSGALRRSFLILRVSLYKINKTVPVVNDTRSFIFHFSFGTQKSTKSSIIILL